MQSFFHVPVLVSLLIAVLILALRSRQHEGKPIGMMHLTIKHTFIDIYVTEDQKVELVTAMQQNKV